MKGRAGRRERTDGRSTRWAGQHERRRAEFVEAALTAIARHGPGTSTVQIAREAGVSRSRLYKHFADSADLQRAIAQRVAALITADLEPAWSPSGSPMQMITTGVRTHLRWLTEHGNLYGYLTRHSLSVAPDGSDAITDIKSALGRHLQDLFTNYLMVFELPTETAEPAGFGIVGLVEGATARWLAHPTRLTRDELTAHLARWIWLMLDDVLRAGGVTLDPDKPLELPGAPSRAP
jgi:AcrR family transcriptional regulator